MGPKAQGWKAHKSKSGHCAFAREALAGSAAACGVTCRSLGWVSSGKTENSETVCVGSLGATIQKLGEFSQGRMLRGLKQP